MMRVVYACVIFFLACLQFCSAHEVNCTVSRCEGLTHYAVSNFTATNCHYSWSNSSDNVLANHKETTEGLVVRKSIRTLITRKCFELIKYEINCVSEGTPREAICTSDCRGNADSQKNGGGISRNHWSTVAANIMLMLLLFLH